MKEKIIYIAADGKEFDEKDECIEYETACMIKGLHFYDDNKKPVLLQSDNFYRFNTVYYVQAESKEALDALNKLCEINGYDIIDYEELNAEYNKILSGDRSFLEEEARVNYNMAREGEIEFRIKK